MPRSKTSKPTTTMINAAQKYTGVPRKSPERAPISESIAGPSPFEQVEQPRHRHSGSHDQRGPALHFFKCVWFGQVQEWNINFSMVHGYGFRCEARKATPDMVVTCRTALSLPRGGPHAGLSLFTVQSAVRGEDFSI